MVIRISEIYRAISEEFGSLEPRWFEGTIYGGAVKSLPPNFYSDRASIDSSYCMYQSDLILSVKILLRKKGDVKNYWVDFNLSVSDTWREEKGVGSIIDEIENIVNTYIVEKF